MAKYVKTEEGYKEYQEIEAINSNKMDKDNPVGTGSFSMGRKAGSLIGANSHAEGNNTTASGLCSHAEGSNTKATSSDYTVISTSDITKGYYTHAEGYGTVAYGRCSHAEGNGTKASGDDSHAEGNYTTASGLCSHAEGNGVKASGSDSHAEGYGTIASGFASHAEGQSTTASHICSHAEGRDTKASGDYSHAQGNATTASGFASHAEGQSTTASGIGSHAEGLGTTASGDYSHAQGKYNLKDTGNKYAHIVGNGSDTYLSNAHTLDWNGVGWFKNSVKVGGSSQDDSAAKTLATTDYVDTTISTKISGKQDTLIQSGASVGQIAKITAVDSNGKPTAWQAVDMPSGGGGVQPDWNQSDETQPDYVKNRPFYTGAPVETVLVEESTVSFAENSGLYMAEFSSTFAATVGETYKVTWDGTAYECICVDLNGFTIIGNLSLAGEGSDTGEPFVMNVINGAGIIYIYTSDTSASHIFSISGFSVEVVKINEQYLPDSAFTEADWDFVSNRPLFYKQLNANIIAENITENIRVGTNYVDLGVTAPDFNEGSYYKVEGEILFFNNNSANTEYRLQINGYYKANSSAKISLGTVYDEYSRKNLDVGFYGGNNSYGHAGKLFVSSSGHSQSYTITANFAIISELKQLSEDYIPNTIQRVGDDVIIASSTANSTKKFKITVDDSGTLTATEVS